MASSALLEEIKPWLSSHVVATLGLYRNDVADISIQCLSADLKRKDAIDQLKPLIRDDTVTVHFVDALYKRFLDLKTAQLQKTLAAATAAKRSAEGVLEGAPAAKVRRSRFEPSSASSPDILANTMKILEEKRQAAASLMAQHGIQVQAGPASENVDKVRKAAELQARIKAQLASKPGLLSGVEASKAQELKPAPVLFDAEGRTVDRSGKALQIPQRQPTIMANIRAKKKEHFEKASRKTPGRTEDESSPFFDPRLSSGAGQRGAKSFKFNEAGKFIRMGQTVRAKAQLEKLQSEIAATAKKTGISAATKLALITPSVDTGEDFIPEVEWWDIPILANGRYPLNADNLTAEDVKGISRLVEHPVPVYPPGEATEVKELPIYLTADEKKKLRKQRRREVELEKQEKIQLGLMEKPETKVKISNLMRVLKTEAVQDPTKMEAHVRAQMAERQKKHEEANKQRKLTKQQKRAKTLRKLTEDTSTGVEVNVFRITDLTNQSIKFKVDTNAQQLHLTGCLLLNKELNLVVVEGGPKCVKKYRNLLLKRIKWTSGGRRGHDDGNASDSEAKQEGSMCQLAWQGTREGRSFYNWSVKMCRTEQQARDQLKKYSVEFYWDLALSQAIVEGEDD